MIGTHGDFSAQSALYSADRCHARLNNLELREVFIVVPTETVPRLIRRPLYQVRTLEDGYLVLFDGAHLWQYSGIHPDDMDLDSLVLAWLYAEVAGR